MSEEKNVPSATPPDTKKKDGKAASAPPKQGYSPTAKKADQVMYLGPMIVEGDPVSGMTFMLKPGTIYKNGLPADVKERVAEDGHLAKMFIPVSNIAAAMRSFNDPDSELSASKKHIAKNRLSGKKARS